MFKKSIKLILILIFMFPVIILAETYSINSDSLSFDLDNSKWDVFTRDNIKDNNLLSKYNTNYENKNSYMQKNNIYVEAISTDNSLDDTELTISIVSQNNFKNMNQLSSEQLDKLLKLYQDNLSSTNTKIHITNNNIKYISLEYTIIVYNCLSYLTIVDYNIYEIKIMKFEKINDSDRAMMQSIIDSIRYPKYESNSKYTAYIIGGLLFVTVLFIAKVLSSRERKHHSPITANNINPINQMNNNMNNANQMNQLNQVNNSVNNANQMNQLNQMNNNV